jgi:hypothetical protein
MTILTSLLPLSCDIYSAFISVVERVHVEKREKSVKFASLLLSLIKSGGMGQDELKRVRVLAEGTSNVSSEKLMIEIGKII